MNLVFMHFKALQVQFIIGYSYQDKDLIQALKICYRSKLFCILLFLQRYWLKNIKYV